MAFYKIAAEFELLINNSIIIMPIELLMPALSPTMTEGNLAKWLVKEGDEVSSGDVIAEIETDKATMEFEASEDGVIGKILIKDGTRNVAVNELIALMLEDGEDASSLDGYEAGSSAPQEEAQKKEENSSKEEDKPANTAQNTTQSSDGDRKFASPLAKRVAENEGVNINGVSGTGPKGRVIKDDVLKAIESGSASQGQAQAVQTSRNPQESTLIPHTMMREVIAKRLQESKQTIPHFYLSVEVNLNKLIALRSQVNATAKVNEEGKPDFKISVNDMVIKASALALQAVPEANASWSDKGMVQYNNVDISVAVSIDGGLITPIVKNADLKPLKAVSNEMKVLARRARKNQLSPEEFQGGGFSISNLGMFNIKQFNAIVNPPQSAILAVGAAEDKLVLDGDKVKTTKSMTITISCDHRVVDGAVGAVLINEIKDNLENPIKLLV